jgi:hypothetical protein
MSNMITFGNGLQKKYATGIVSPLSKNGDFNKADHEALQKASAKKRAEREARMDARQSRLNNNNPEVALKILEENPTKDLNVVEIQKKARGETNALAREYGLSQPNNPEALAHDRLHCMMCDRTLDSPHVGQFGENSIFDEEDVRLMCCWCFGKMSDSDIKHSINKKEATAEIRLKVYNPDESTKAEIESLIESKMIQMKSKLRKWKQDTALVGNVKHDYLEEGDQFENQVLYRAPTRYTACTL